MKRRYNLVPNLVETVKGYANHEAGTLEKLTQARVAALSNEGTPGAQAQTENLLVGLSNRCSQSPRTIRT